MKYLAPLFALLLGLALAPSARAAGSCSGQWKCGVPIMQAGKCTGCDKERVGWSPIRGVNIQMKLSGQRWKAVAVLLAGCGLVVGCSSSPAATQEAAAVLTTPTVLMLVPTATPEPVNVVTVTPVPTETPTATSTQTPIPPTATPEPPTATPEETYIGGLTETELNEYAKELKYCGRNCIREGHFAGEYGNMFSMQIALTGKIVQEDVIDPDSGQVAFKMISGLGVTIDGDGNPIIIKIPLQIDNGSGRNEAWNHYSAFASDLGFIPYDGQPDMGLQDLESLEKAFPPDRVLSIMFLTDSQFNKTRYQWKSMGILYKYEKYRQGLKDLIDNQGRSYDNQSPIEIFIAGIGVVK